MLKVKAEERKEEEVNKKDIKKGKSGRGDKRRKGEEKRE